VAPVSVSATGGGFPDSGLRLIRAIRLQIGISHAFRIVILFYHRRISDKSSASGLYSWFNAGVYLYHCINAMLLPKE
ncbi:hypothetical protein ABLV66_09495, partial [Klebsiella sp. CN_Kp073]